LTKDKTESKIENKIEPLEILLSCKGIYTGLGVNHEDVQFRGLLEIIPVVNDKGVNIKYRAVGIHGNEFDDLDNLFSSETVLFNEEHTLIAYNNHNKLCLWTLNYNVPTVCVFKLRRFRRIPGNKTIFIFGFGERSDEKIFREEISIEIWDAGNIAYNYYWGEAGGHFLSRSTVIMRKL